MDMELYGYELGFGLNFMGMSKVERLVMGES